MAKFRFFLDGIAIPTNTEKPVKRLGKIFECSFSDATAIQATTKEFRILSHQLTNLGYLAGLRLVFTSMGFCLKSSGPFWYTK